MINNNPVTVVSFAHFGYKKDLKSTPTYYSAKNLADSDLLRQIVVLDIERTYNIDPSLFSVPVPGGKFLPRIFYLMSKFVGPVDGRSLSLKLFDSFAAKEIQDRGILHTFPHTVKTIQTAKKRNKTVVAYAASSHPTTTYELLEDECQRLDIDNPDNVNENYKKGIVESDYILTLSEYSRETFVKQGVKENKILTVGPLSANLNEYPPTEPPEGEFIVLAVANITVLKGIHYLLDAWRKLDLPNSRLILCGTMNSAIKPVLKPLISEMDDVDYVGYVENPQPYYDLASVLVHPSLSESFGKVIAEAMASKVPVIVTEHCPTEYVDDAGLVVPIRDSDAIAEQIQCVYDNPDQASTMGRRGRQIVKDNTWDDFSERVKKAHKEIILRE